jgi:predicted secreted protein
VTCPGCQEAETNPKNWEIFYAGCQSCEARAVLRDEAAQDALRLKEMTPAYRRLLDKIFGKDWKAGHELVKEWNEKLTTRKAT